MFIWRPEPQDIIAMRSIITHRASIKSVKILEEFKNDLTFFGTISEDNTCNYVIIQCVFGTYTRSVSITESLLTSLS